MVRALGVIPARYASTRFPGKPLAPLGGRTLIEEVWRRARAATALERVVIASEDARVIDAARAFGAEAWMTSADHVSGTDRVAEVASRLGPEWTTVVNIQGDEPMVTPASLDRLVHALGRADSPLATLAEPIMDTDALFDPNVVKVVVTRDGRALYFSRCAIPFHRGTASVLDADFRRALAGRPGGLGGYRKHQGIYAYSRETLATLTALPPSALELDEGLEQLRALEAGITIRVIESDFQSLAVDTPEDLARVERHLSRMEA